MTKKEMAYENLLSFTSFDNGELMVVIQIRNDVERTGSNKFCHNPNLQVENCNQNNNM